MSDDIRQAYRDVFNGPSGVKVFNDLFNWCGGFAPSHVRGDPYETAFNEGMRNVLLRIVNFTDFDVQIGVRNVRKLDDGRSGE